MDCSLPGSSVHGIFQAKVLEWGAIAFSERRLSAKELMLLNCGVEKTLERVPWTARRSNQSILKEISPEYSLEGLILKYWTESPILWPPDVKNWLIGKDPDDGKD